MFEDPVPPDRGPPEPVNKGERGSGVIFALVVIALILAIIFFYLTREAREDRRAEAVTRAASVVDDAARAMGDTAKTAADRLRDQDDKDRLRLKIVHAD
ncbi:MAG: hypothetical protein AABZ73_08635 [Pseudomonadota bacterium]|uniref:hypothetical protein n=1 Tax=Sphingobium sp. TaxID=1912891 RepID=UPI002E1D31BB